MSDKLNDEKLRDISGGTGDSGTYDRNPGGVCFAYNCEFCGAKAIYGSVQYGTGVCDSVHVEHDSKCQLIRSTARCDNCCHRVGDTRCSAPNNLH